MEVRGPEAGGRGEAARERRVDAVIGVFTLQHPLMVAWVVALTSGAAWVLRERGNGGKRWKRVGWLALWVTCWSVPAAWLGNQASWAGQAGAFVMAVCALVVAIREAYRRQQVNHGAAWGAMTARVLAGVLALAVIGRPVWEWSIEETRKPKLIVVLDDSRSMDVADMPSEKGALVRRVEAVKREVSGSGVELARLDDLYEVRFLRFSTLSEKDVSGDAEAKWTIDPRVEVSPLAAALRKAGATVDADNQKPAAIVVMTDGAETVESDAAVGQAAGTFERAGIALHAVGCAPPLVESRLVELSPLDVPSQVTSHERVVGVLTGRIRGLKGGVGALELKWNTETTSSSRLEVGTDDMEVRHAFDVAAPWPGLHRLTATLTVRHGSTGEERSEVQAIVEVTEGRVRVLLLDGAPRTETAFVARALEGDPRFEVTRRYLPRTPELVATGETADAEYWSGIDVVVWGLVPRWRMKVSVLERLRDEVLERGVGLLLAGGEDMFAGGAFAGTPMEELSPAGFPARSAREARRVGITTRFTPTDAGLRHAALRLSESPEKDRESWSKIAALGHATALRELSPLSTVLATDGGGRVIMAAHEAGAGRCIAVGWESTWSWALGSDEGLAMHRTVWRQMAQWLANRRPRAWVLTEESTYVWEALRNGGRTVRIRAGVTGMKEQEIASRGTGVGATSKPASALAPGGARMEIAGPDGTTSVVTPTALKEGWEAEFQPPEKGEYRVTFGVEGGEAGRLTAATTFRVEEENLELRRPTAKLELLRSAALATAERGGSYVHISEFKELIRRLLATDRRQRVERRERYDVVDGHRWSALAAIAALFCVEWVIRKRAGVV